MNAYRFLSTVLAVLLTVLLSSCLKEVDPGPLQRAQKEFTLFDFDRLDVGDDFILTVQQGPIYTVHLEGDKRNINDVSVLKVGTTLKVSYQQSGNREHPTNVMITLPVLMGASLSGASNVTVVGFKNVKELEFILSGAAMGQLNIEAKRVVIHLSGASKLSVSGKSDAATLRVSGASELLAYSLAVEDVDAETSGAAKLNVYALLSLKATATGASSIFYRGNATVTSVTNGAAIVKPD